MVGWHHRVNGHEFEQTPGDGGGQGSLQSMGPKRVGYDLANEQQRDWQNIVHHQLDFNKN